MANRSYLYATDLVPSHDNLGQRRRITGLSECRYALPGIYGMLMCGSPRLCLSNIWQFRTEEGGPSHPLALAAPFQEGLGNLRFVRKNVRNAAAVAVLDEALSFLERPENQLEFLLLEPAEYFDMFGEDEGMTGKLHEQIAAAHQNYLGDATDSFLEVAASLDAIVDDGTPEGSQAALAAVRDILGHCEWSNILYQSPGEHGAC